MAGRLPGRSPRRSFFPLVQRESTLKPIREAVHQPCGDVAPDGPSAPRDFPALRALWTVLATAVSSPEWATAVGDALEGRVDRLETAVQGLETAVQGIQTDVRVLQTDVRVLQTSVQGLEAGGLVLLFLVVGSYFLTRSDMQERDAVARSDMQERDAVAEIKRKSEMAVMKVSMNMTFYVAVAALVVSVMTLSPFVITKT